MDATHPFEIQDLQIADLVEREGRGLVFVLAKWDLVEDPQARLAEVVEEAQRQLPQVRGAPIVALSAETGRGLDRLMPAVFKTYADWSTKVKTRDLNDWLQMAIQRHPPPAVNGRRIKPKYMAQTKARPPTFVLFATRAEQLPESYRRYLINSLRESFDLPGVPLRVTVKSSRNPYAEGEAPAQPAPRARVSAQPAAAKAKPKPKSKPGKAAKAKPGAPRGRAQKLARPGVKPKRASRPTSTRKTPR
jgi:GTP-binding protein